MAVYEYQEGVTPKKAEMVVRNSLMGDAKGTHITYLTEGNQFNVTSGQMLGYHYGNTGQNIIPVIYIDDTDGAAALGYEDSDFPWTKAKAVRNKNVGYIVTYAQERLVIPFIQPIFAKGKFSCIK